jgi:drug/metabolite transporter (DMT)-like permease
MHHSILSIIIGIALLQTGSWVARKAMTNGKKVNQNSIIIAESIMITIILFIYIFYKTPPKEIYNDLLKLSPKKYLFLFLIALCVVGAIVLIFDLIPKIEISKLGPSVSIVRIIMLTILGFLVFGEKITIKKIASLILMVVGVALLINE